MSFLGRYSLQDISVEGLLAVAEELSDHLPTQALPLQQKVGHADGCVRDETTRDQKLEAFVGVSGMSQTLEERRSSWPPIYLCSKA